MKTESMGSLSDMRTSESTGKHLCMKQVVGVTMALWLGLVLLLGARGAFAAPPGLPPLPIFFGFAIPLAVFFGAYFGWGRFRAFVLGADLRFVAAMQGWRWAGLGFLSLYAHNVLPGLFAFPAGLGDMAVGFTAPWIVLGLVRQPSFAASKRFVTWNILGILDLVVAVSLGTICSGFIHGLTGNITTSAMSQLPLALVPAYLVPFFIMLHFTALAQARRMAKSLAPIE
ncbi:MAG TPA: hypothetical protein VMF08_04910 [Candidatus Sulfotelmatobacter sp.]|nr:hypothetical protein [Candidatus Sulfotelmatobacter sp.]